MNHSKEIKEMMRKLANEEIERRLAATLAETREVEARTAQLELELQTIMAEIRSEDERIEAQERENLRKEAFIAEKEKEIEETDREIAKVRAQIAELKEQKAKKLERAARNKARDEKIARQAAELKMYKEGLAKVFSKEMLKAWGFVIETPESETVDLTIVKQE